MPSSATSSILSSNIPREYKSKKSSLLSYTSIESIYDLAKFVTFPTSIAVVLLVSIISYKSLM